MAGAHLSGMALNPQLTSLGARLLERTHTAPNYRFYALQTEPPKPGLVRVAPGEPGHAIEVEVWELSSSALGTFVSALPAPMCLGSVELASGAGQRRQLTGVTNYGDPLSGGTWGTVSRPCAQAPQRE